MKKYMCVCRWVWVWACVVVRVCVPGLMHVQCSHSDMQFLSLALLCSSPSSFPPPPPPPTSHTPKSNIMMTVFQAAHIILVFFVTCESHQQFPCPLCESGIIPSDTLVSSIELGTHQESVKRNQSQTLTGQPGDLAHWMKMVHVGET